nr:retrovirus-related Pol polyprotein from transposon TNT 1-94 [Tanacetum cinerariifolium]
MKAKAKPFPPCIHCGFNDYRPDDCRNYPECKINESYDHSTSGHNHVIHIKEGVLVESSQSNESTLGVKCNTCGSTVHSTSDHNEYDHFKRGNNTKVSRPINEPLVPDATQSHILNQASTSSHPTPQDRWSRDQHIKLVNIISNPGKGMLTRSMVAKLTAASASECLFADFLFEIEPKKVFGALKHPGWIDSMQEELNQFYRNKDTEDPPDLINIEGTHELNVQNDQMIT